MFGFVTNFNRFIFGFVTKFLILYLDLCKKMYLCGEIKIANHYVSKKCNKMAQKLED